MTELAFLEEAFDRTDATAFVHVGDRFDDAMRYLTRFSGPDRRYAFVFVPATRASDDRSHAVLCAPGLFVEQARREFVDQGVREPRVRDSDAVVGRSVESGSIGDPPGERAAGVLDRLLGDRASGTVLVPQHLPHADAVRLQEAGYELRSTEAVETARRRKTDAEIDRLGEVQEAAVAGLRRGEAVLARSDVAAGSTGDETLSHGGEPLTTERLRRAIDAELRAVGVRDAGNTVIGAGRTAADLHFTGDVPIAAGETVLIDVSPRGPAGYYGDLTRTFVVDSDGGWERRAYVTVEAARTAALEALEPGVLASRVHAEAAAEIAAYGFSIDAGEGEAGFTHGTGHGVGLSLHEGPSLRSDRPLEAGNVITIEPGVYDPDRGGVRLEDLVVVTDGEPGYELLGTYPLSIGPRDRECSSDR